MTSDREPLSGMCSVTEPTSALSLLLTSTTDSAEETMTITTSGALRIGDYLARIGLDGTPGPSPEALRVLQRAHLTHVPFDTIERFLTRDEHLDPRSVVDRIVVQKRGGSGSQLNVGFGALLHGLGYLVDLVLARVSEARTHFDQSHLALIVACSGRRFLIDVSGALSDEPLALDTEATQVDTAGAFAVSTRPGHHFDVFASDDRHYAIDTMPVFPSDQARQLVAAEHEHGAQFSNEAGPVLSIRRPRGRTTLIGNKLVETVGTARTVITLEPASLQTVSEQRFGVTLDRRSALAFLQAPS